MERGNEKLNQAIRSQGEGIAIGEQRNEIGDRQTETWPERKGGRGRGRQRAQWNLHCQVKEDGEEV